LTHDAHFQSIDESKLQFQGNRGSELNFRDCWKFNVAAYRLAEMIGIEDMVPMSVERKHAGNSGSITWWVDGVKMDEQGRRSKRITPPDLQSFNRQTHIMRVFDEWIYNTDRNMGNLLYTEDWRMMMIDHTRAFRMMRELKEPGVVKSCDRHMIEAMRSLDAARVEARVAGYLNRMEIQGLLSRRDRIVTAFDRLGEGALFDRRETMAAAR
jgi:hypothetical protein